MCLLSEFSGACLLKISISTGEEKDQKYVFTPLDFQKVNFPL